MEDSKKKTNAETDKEIVFSRTIKAGKRIYYLDVKKNRRNDMFISITESKKIVPDGDESKAFFEKHKIFLYQEDFGKFMHGMEEAMQFIESHRAPFPADAPEEDGQAPLHTDEINIDIDF